MRKAEQGRSGIFLPNAVLRIHCSKTRMISSKLQIIRVFSLRHSFSKPLFNYVQLNRFELSFPFQYSPIHPEFGRIHRGQILCEKAQP